MKNGYTYLLIDPETAQIRYVGSAKRPARRYAEHLRRDGSSRKMRQWIDDLLHRKQKPEMMEIGPAEQESFWIATLRRAGFALLNISDGRIGGDVYWSRGPSEETEARRRARISAKLKGRKFSFDSRAKMSEAGRKKVFSPTHRAALSRAHGGIRQTSETKAKISQANRGNQRWLGKKHTPETIMKMRAAALNREASKRGGMFRCR